MRATGDAIPGLTAESRCSAHDGKSTVRDHPGSRKHARVGGVNSYERLHTQQRYPQIHVQRNRMEAITTKSTGQTDRERIADRRAISEWLFPPPGSEIRTGSADEYDDAGHD